MRGILFWKGHTINSLKKKKKNTALIGIRRKLPEILKRKIQCVPKVRNDLSHIPQ